MIGVSGGLFRAVDDPFFLSHPFTLESPPSLSLAASARPSGSARAPALPFTSEPPRRWTNRRPAESGRGKGPRSGAPEPRAGRAAGEHGEEPPLAPVARWATVHRSTGCGEVKAQTNQRPSRRRGPFCRREATAERRVSGASLAQTVHIFLWREASG